MIESRFQRELIKEIKYLFNNCVVLKTDSNYIQGFPDLLILYNNNWAALECKRSIDECFSPNQEYYLRILNDMSFAAMVCPENKEGVLYELQQAFKA